MSGAELVALPEATCPAGGEVFVQQVADGVALRVARWPAPLAGRIDQVTQNFFLRPFLRRRSLGNFWFLQCLQQWNHVVDNLNEFVSGCSHHDLVLAFELAAWRHANSSIRAPTE